MGVLRVNVLPALLLVTPEETTPPKAGTLPKLTDAADEPLPASAIPLGADTNAKVRVNWAELRLLHNNMATNTSQKPRILPPPAPLFTYSQQRACFKSCSVRRSGEVDGIADGCGGCREGNGQLKRVRRASIGAGRGQRSCSRRQCRSSQQPGIGGVCGLQTRGQGVVGTGLVGELND